MSLADRLAERLKSTGPPALTLISRRCLRSRLQNSACARCVNECPAQAIRAEPGLVRLDAKRCTGCLACTAVCPAEALVGNDPRLAAAQTRPAGRQPRTFCCEKGIRSGEETVLPCLGALSVEELAAHAASAEITLFLAPCRNCRSAAVAEILGRRVADLAARLTDAGLSAAIHLLLTEAAAGDQAAVAGRRAFFRAFGHLSFHAAVETMTALREETGPKEAQGHRHLPGRLALLQRASSGENDPTRRAVLLRLFFTLRAEESCNFCGGCAGMCPSGAIRNIREEGDRSLAFDWAKCSGCGLCLEFCRKKALTLVAGRPPEACTAEWEILFARTAS